MDRSVKPVHMTSATPGNNVSKTYSPITPDQMDKFRTEAAANGITIPEGNSGRIIAHGVTMGFEYVGTTLNLSIVNKPFYIPESVIWNQIEPFLS